MTGGDTESGDDTNHLETVDTINLTDCLGETDEKLLKIVLVNVSLLTA